MADQTVLEVKPEIVLRNFYKIAHVARKQLMSGEEHDAMTMAIHQVESVLKERIPEPEKESEAEDASKPSEQ